MLMILRCSLNRTGERSLGAEGSLHLTVSNGMETSALPLHGTEFYQHLNEQGNGLVLARTERKAALLSL